MWASALRRRVGTAAATGATTVDAAEVRKFAALADKWWDVRSKEFGALHALNAVRVPLVRDAALGALERWMWATQGRCGAAPEPAERDARPLRGKRVLDVGCGGGILAEGIARLGAEVLGIDAAPENVRVAQEHARLDPGLHVHYQQVLVEELAAGAGGDAAEGFDVVVTSEVLEHVRDVDRFVSACLRLTKPGGRFVATTLNRTALSFLTAVVGAEYVAGLVPPGTHDWAKFVRPDDLRRLCAASAAGADVDLLLGLHYDPWSGEWAVGGHLHTNYALVATARPRA